MCADIFCYFQKINQACVHICEYRSVARGNVLKVFYRSVYISTPLISDHW